MPDMQEVERLQMLAAEAHQAAEKSPDPEAKRVLLFIAAAYDRLARFAEAAHPHMTKGRRRLTHAQLREP